VGGGGGGGGPSRRLAYPPDLGLVAYKPVEAALF